MRHLKLLIAVVAALMTVTAAIASTAQANPELKAAKYPVEVKGEGTGGELKSGSSKITCESNTLKGEIKNATESKLEVTSLGCSDEGVKCHSETAENSKESKTAGEIIIFAPAGIVLVDNGPGMGATELYYYAYVIVLVLLKCGVITVDTDGTVLILLNLEQSVPVLSATLEASEELNSKEEGTGKQALRDCEEPVSICGAEKERKTLELSSEFTEGKKESSVLIQKDAVTFGEEVTAVN